MTNNHDLKLLAVSPKKESTDVYSKFFHSKGFKVTGINEEGEAITHIKKDRFDVILLDIELSVISGFGIIELLLEEDILKDQNIIVISEKNLFTINQKELLSKPGIIGVFKKPINHEDLLTIILANLDKYY